MASYLLQEDGVGKFTLEDGSGFLLLESSTVAGVGPYGSPVLDNFDRADAATLGANWSPVLTSTGYPDFQVLSQQAAPASGGPPAKYAADVWNPNTFGPDCEVFATAVQGGGMLLARFKTTGTPPIQGYALSWDAGHVYLSRWDSGSGYTALATFNTAGANAGDRVALACIGSALEAWVDNGNTGTWFKAGTFTDTTYSPAGYIGIFSNDSATGVFDDVGGGTITTAPPTPTGGSHVIAIAPRRRLLDKRRRRGRLKWPLALVDVYAPSPRLQVAFGSRSAVLDARAGRVETRLSFVLKPARAIAHYTKERSVERELQIRKAIIADLFNRDDH